MYVKFQKILMTRCRDMDKKHQKCPKNRALSLLYPYGALTICKKLENTRELSLRYLKTDTHTDTHGQGRLLRTPSGKPGESVYPPRVLTVTLKVSLEKNRNVSIKYLRIRWQQQYKLNSLTYKLPILFPSPPLNIENISKLID